MCIRARSKKERSKGICGRLHNRKEQIQGSVINPIKKKEKKNLFKENNFGFILKK